MMLDNAIKTAIEYENKVRDVYIEAAQKAGTETAKGFYSAMADEEQAHVDYLNERLKEWEKDGKVRHVEITTRVPKKQKVEESLKNLKKTVKGKNQAGEIEVLRKALKFEQGTSNFYKRMVDELKEEDRDLFKRFLEIEEGHLYIVQAEIDYATHIGDFFNLEQF
jgi:rubrerythrin